MFIVNPLGMETNEYENTVLFTLDRDVAFP